MCKIIIAKRAEDGHPLDLTIGLALLRSLVFLLLLAGTVLLFLIIPQLAFYFFTHMYKYYINEASFAALALYALHQLEGHLLWREAVTYCDWHLYAQKITVELEWDCVGLLSE